VLRRRKSLTRYLNASISETLRADRHQKRFNRLAPSLQIVNAFIDNFRSRQHIVILQQILRKIRGFENEKAAE